MSAEQLAATIKQQVLLLMPEINLELSLAHEIDESENERMIQTDASLLPALLALIENAGSASLAHSGESRVLVSVKVDAGSHRLCISVKDFGAGIPKEMQLQLGHKLIESERGMGMALLLSNASFERLGGQLLLSSANEGGTIAKVCFPVYESISASQVGAA